MTRTKSRPRASKAICTGFASSGNSFSEAKRLTFMPEWTFIRPMASSGSRKICVPPGPFPGLLVMTGMKAGRWSRRPRVFALGARPDAPVPVGGHDVQDLHLPVHDLPVGLIPVLQVGAPA